MTFDRSSGPATPREMAPQSGPASARGSAEPCSSTPCHRPQRDGRVGDALCGSRGGLHRDWRADRVGDGCGELEAAHQIRRVVSGENESQRGACLFRGPRDRARGVSVTIAFQRRSTFLDTTTAVALTHLHSTCLERRCQVVGYSTRTRIGVGRLAH